MIYKEIKQDLFKMPEEYYLAHCISADFGTYKGVVVEFNKRFDMKRKLQSKYPDYVNQYTHYKLCGDCILEGRVLNLITKERYFHKPTYTSLVGALMICRDLCIKHGIKKIAMPTIGSGLDRLKWESVSRHIQSVFQNTDIEIVVCKL